jgi:hypothetical protein
MEHNKQDIYGYNTNCTNADFWDKPKGPKYHTYILQYCSAGNRGIKELLNEYLKKYCVLLVTCGRGGGGGVTFASELDLGELHRVICTYDLEFILYQMDTGKNSWRTEKENGVILDKIFGNNAE